jgi:fluoride exporter
MRPPTHSATFHPSTRSARTLAAVAAGGALGTLSRYSLDRALPTSAGHFPTATLLINLSGSLLIGLLLPLVLIHATERPLVRPFLVTGVLGGWTTYSALATDTVTLLKTGHAWLALGDLGATVLGGLALVTVGFFASPAHTFVRYRQRANGDQASGDIA